jgi:hypothetical protein
MVNGKLAGLLVAGLLLGTGAVNAAESAFPKSVDEAGIHLSSQSTYADQHRGMLGTAESAFPKGVDEAGVRLPSRSTYADAHRGKMLESMQAEVTRGIQLYAID